MMMLIANTFVNSESAADHRQALPDDTSNSVIYYKISLLPLWQSYHNHKARTRSEGRLI